jgi:hypothetical protein
MMHPTQLPADVLAEIVSQIQQLLWLDAAGCGQSPADCGRSPDRATSGDFAGCGRSPDRATSGDFWNGEKEWDGETLESVAAVLEKYGLRPEGEEVEPTVMVERTL